MRWVIQNNIFKEEKYDELISTLDRFSIPFSTHKVVPFVGELIPEPEINKEERSFFFGSYSMRHAAVKYNGIFWALDWFEFEEQKKIWGENLLNFDAKTLKFKDVVLSEDSFIKPSIDSKFFTGKVFSPEEFEEWKHKVVILEEDYGNSLTKDTLVIASKPKNIYSEVRFWIVNNIIVTYSQYKIGNRVLYNRENVSEEMKNYVRKMIDLWDEPEEGYVIDVANTSEGFRIVELNSLNSCGLYDADVQKLVFAIEDIKK